MVITICVLAYNSQNYITDCLDSILAQQGGVSDVHLIVADDCSADATAATVDNWMVRHASAFAQTTVIVRPKNIGTVASVNDALKQANTEWFKCIGADDEFKPDALQQVARFIETQVTEDTAVIASQFASFGDIEGVIKPTPITLDVLEHADAKRFDKALCTLRLGGGNIAPGAYVRVSALRAIGGFCTQYDVLEDLPTWDALLTAGYRFQYMPIVTVGYRMHQAQTVGRVLGARLGADLTRYANYVKAQQGVRNHCFAYSRLYNIAIASKGYPKRVSQCLLYLNPFNVVAKIKDS